LSLLLAHLRLSAVFTYLCVPHFSESCPGCPVGQHEFCVPIHPIVSTGRLCLSPPTVVTKCVCVFVLPHLLSPNRKAPDRDEAHCNNLLRHRSGWPFANQVPLNSHILLLFVVTVCLEDGSFVLFPNLYPAAASPVHLVASC